jgi:hypothetical protein
MSQSAYIQLVAGSKKDSITLDDVLAILEQYRSQTALTGKQLDWSYEEMAFPYTIEERTHNGVNWLCLKGNQPDYRYIWIAVGTKQRDDQTIPYIQIFLPDGSTHGDKAKANEFCKYFGKQLQAEVLLFNGRTMYFNPRK